ncbi:MAG TPA: glycosyltransferase family 2 protein, partial [Anaerolineae bacterium]|nr:glycosyltransferase family 2 protein [Anaerolineae bacterium]
LEGRNCGMTRLALETVRAFDDDVQTGTDYFLAQKLLKSGYRIRFVPGSTVHTALPEDVDTYVRKQSRWIRNLLVHGPAFGAWGDVAAALRTGCVGTGMLLAPLLSLALGGWILAAWGLLLSHAVLSRLRYFAFAQGLTGQRFGWRVQARIVPYLFVDFYAWARSLLDYALPWRRAHW